MNLSSNPVLVFSLVNTLLRDKYKNLDDLCEYEDINQDELIDKLNKAGYRYIKEINQFR